MVYTPIKISMKIIDTIKKISKCMNVFLRSVHIREPLPLSLVKYSNRQQSYREIRI